MRPPSPCPPYPQRKPPQTNPVTRRRTPQTTPSSPPPDPNDIFTLFQLKSPPNSLGQGQGNVGHNQGHGQGGQGHGQGNNKNMSAMQQQQQQQQQQSMVGTKNFNAQMNSRNAAQRFPPPAAQAGPKFAPSAFIQQSMQPGEESGECLYCVSAALTCVCLHLPSLFNCLIGLVVKALASGAEDPGFESRLRLDFLGVESYQ